MSFEVTISSKDYQGISTLPDSKGVAEVPENAEDDDAGGRDPLDLGQVEEVAGLEYDDG